MAGAREVECGDGSVSFSYSMPACASGCRALMVVRSRWSVVVQGNEVERLVSRAQNTSPARRVLTSITHHFDSISFLYIYILVGETADTKLRPIIILYL